jgi:hypothetical protein
MDGVCAVHGWSQSAHHLAQVRIYYIDAHRPAQPRRLQIELINTVLQQPARLAQLPAGLRGLQLQPDHRLRRPLPLACMDTPKPLERLA